MSRIVLLTDGALLVKTDGATNIIYTDRTIGPVEQFTSALAPFPPFATGPGDRMPLLPYIANRHVGVTQYRPGLV